MVIFIHVLVPITSIIKSTKCSFNYSAETNIFSEQNAGLKDYFPFEMVPFQLTCSLSRSKFSHLSRQAQEKLLCKHASFGDHVAETFPPGRTEWCYRVSSTNKTPKDNPCVDLRICLESWLVKGMFKSKRNLSRGYRDVIDTIHANSQSGW